MMKTVGLFCGGFSSEFEISMKSAQTIAEHFPEEYRVVKIEVTREQWFAHTSAGKVPFSMEAMSWEENGTSQKIDTGLIYIHGNPGENGKIQAYLDMKGIPYVNSGALASELSFDKWFCNQFLKRFGINVADSLFLRSRNAVAESDIMRKLGLPCFVKPSDSGSSFGISRVNNTDDMGAALDKAFAEGGTVVVESFLAGTEVTCGIYRTKDGLNALPLTEIVSENEFFDYEAKYQGKSQEITPARITDELRDKVQFISREVYELLQLRSIARIDFMIVDETPFVIEVNTTPGFSAASLVPQMLAEAGISIKDFWRSIMEAETSHR